MIIARSDPEPVHGPLFETEADRAAQRAIMLRCLVAWGSPDALDLGIGYPIDYALMPAGTEGPVPYRSLAGRDAILGHVEIKRRRVFSRTYQTVYFEIRKRDALLAAQERFGGGTYFVVGYNDGIYWISAHRTIGMPVIRAGRKDRGLAEDMDDCVDVPVERMRSLRIDERGG